MFNREQRRELAKLSKVELIANLELEHDRMMQYQALAIKSNEDAQQQTKNALAMAIQNMTPVAMEVLQEQYNFTESEAKKFEVAFFSKFRDLLDRLGMEEQGQAMETTEQTATKSKIIIP